MRVQDYLENHLLPLKTRRELLHTLLHENELTSLS